MGYTSGHLFAGYIFENPSVSKAGNSSFLPYLLMMDSVDNKHRSALSPPQTTPLNPLYASKEILIPDRTFPLEGYHILRAPVPELRLSTQNTDNDVIVDPIKCCCASSDLGHEVDDDLFSMYINLEKLEEQQGNADHHHVNINGGGFVIDGEVDGGRRLRYATEEEDKNPTRKTQRANEKKTCSADDVRVLEPRKTILAEELAKLWDINPKRAQRIMSNRQSAARSKEKRARYKLDLEETVKRLHAKTMELNSKIAAIQMEITDLAAEKSELKLQLQTMEHQVELYDAQNEELQREIRRLKAATGETD